jgi:hypothetical protein
MPLLQAQGEEEVTETLNFIAFTLVVLTTVVIILLAKVIEIQNFLKKGQMKL